ncbi:HTTM domain-containing protein [Halohasta salina]|uniref:HTTM domain-containing protein n=1 Tax=Halohasta salina TaxID=2961621 RepID=UPI0020A2F39B|nr:HTTM domain-containing protein [Halohasta salina]
MSELDDGTGERVAGDRLVRALLAVWARIRARFAVDTRSLAAFRIGLGVTLLVDLLGRGRHIRTFYTDSGVYPLAAYESTYPQYTGLSIHALSGEVWLQQLLFSIAGIVAVAFAVGYRSRLTGAASLGLLLSLHARTPTVLNGGDRLLAVLLLVALLAPIGERWSVDALRRGSARRRIASFGTAAVLCQPLVVFATNAALKHRGDRWYAGEALGIALENDLMTVGLGNHLADYPTLVTGLTYAWVTLLAGSVLFLLVPVGRLRTAAALGYMGAFVGMALTMTVGLFPLVLTVALLPFLAAPFWDRVARYVPRSWLDRLPIALPRRLGRPPLERRLLAAAETRGYGEFAASTRAAARSLLAVAGALAVVWMVAYGAADATAFELPEPVDDDRLDQQRWGLYAPDPSTGYSWYVVEADLGGEAVVADLPGTADSFDRPPDVAATHPTFRYRKHMAQVRSAGEDADTPETVAVAYAAWACRQVAAARGETPTELTVYQHYQQIPVDSSAGDAAGAQHRDLVIERGCGG